MKKSKFENDNHFLPWNNPMEENDPFKPWNDVVYKDDPFAPWNNVYSNQNDYIEYCKRKNIRK